MNKKKIILLNSHGHPVTSNSHQQSIFIASL